MFRSHLRLLAAAGQLGPEIVAVGPWWSTDGQVEIDAVALAGRSRTPVLVGEAKWSRQVDGAALTARLRRHAVHLPGADPDTIRPVICARTDITGAPPDALAVTAADIMSADPIGALGE